MSVGLIVHDGERYLPAALESILLQDFPDFELIISDNASIDGTERICREVAARDPRARYLRSEVNYGAAWNCNHVIRLARGRFFKLATHDDVLARGYLRTCVEALEAAPASVVGVYPRTVLIGPDGSTLGPYEDRLDLREPSPAARLAHLVREIRLANPVLGLIRLEALRRTGGFRNVIGSDNLLLAELCLLGEIQELPEPLYQRRIHPRSSSRVFPGLRERMRWLDPFFRSPVASFPVTRLLVEHLRIIAAAPIPRPEKARAAARFLPAFLRARAWHRYSELRGLGVRLLRAGRAQGGAGPG